MPNWVFNSLAVSGDKSELNKMIEQLNQPFVKHFPEHKFENGGIVWVADEQHYDNPVFAFWNILKPTDLEAYYGDEVYKKTNLPTDEFMAEFVRSMREDNDWYHWNCRNWGTKWDVAVSNGDEYADTQLEWTGDEDVLIRFNTAWSPVHQVLIKLSEQYPTLDFDYEYEEEQGWGGSATFKAGEEIASDEYDIPSSHADYKSLERECQCEYNDIEYAFEDCPVDTEKYQWDGEEWQEKTLDSATQVR